MIQRQLSGFLATGLVSVALAYGVYRGLLETGVGIEIANGVAYLSGMTFGFFANKFFTFHEFSAMSTRQTLHYLALHICTLGVNMAVNLYAFEVTRGMVGQLLISFSLAIVASTLLNFLGLKYWVFNRKKNSIV